MEENPTKYVDGKPIEWPVRPNRKLLYDKINELSERLETIKNAY